MAPRSKGERVVLAIRVSKDLRDRLHQAAAEARRDLGVFVVEALEALVGQLPVLPPTLKPKPAEPPRAPVEAPARSGAKERHWEPTDEF